MREQKKHCLYVLGIAEKVQFRHCKPGPSPVIASLAKQSRGVCHCELGEAISVIRFDKKPQKCYKPAYNTDKVINTMR